MNYDCFHIDVTKNNTVLGLYTINNNTNNDTCAICLYDEHDEIDDEMEEYLNASTYEPIRKYAKLCFWKNNNFGYICKHIAHTHCLYDWIKTSNKFLCPTCKQGFDEKLDNIEVLYESTAEHIIKQWSNGNIHQDYWLYNENYHGNYIEYTIDNKKTKDINYNYGTLHGDYKIWFDDGKLKESANYNNGLKIGQYLLYDKEGKIIIKSDYDTNGNLHGKHYEFIPYVVNFDKSITAAYKIYTHYNNGLYDGIYKEVYYHSEKYKKRVCYKNGMKNGYMMEWDDNGQLIMKCFYINNKLNGIMQKWDDRGNLILRCYFVNDKYDCEFMEYRRGILIKSVNYKNCMINGDFYEMQGEGFNEKNIYCHYVNGILQDKYIEKDMDGRTLLKCNYKNGKLDGIYNIYNKGSLYISKNYENGMLHGNVCTYDYKRMVKCEVYKYNKLIRIYDYNDLVIVDYKDGKPHGLYEKRYKSGNIMMKCNYMNGKLCGKYEEYYENGKIKYKKPID